jgi:hypothetical protein
METANSEVNEADLRTKHQVCSKMGIEETDMDYIEKAHAEATELHQQIIQNQKKLDEYFYWKKLQDKCIESKSNEQMKMMMGEIARLKIRRRSMYSGMNAVTNAIESKRPKREWKQDVCNLKRALEADKKIAQNATANVKIIQSQNESLNKNIRKAKYWFVQNKNLAEVMKTVLAENVKEKAKREFDQSLNWHKKEIMKEVKVTLESETDSETDTASEGESEENNEHEEQDIAAENDAEMEA